MAIFAWQGWQTTLPDECEPVSVSGSFDAGQVLMADLFSPRLGLRWERLGKRTGAKEWARMAMVGQVGQLAAREAVKKEAAGWSEVLCYREPNPPGRDVWVGQSCSSERAVTVIEHVGQGARTFIESLPENLSDSASEEELPWAVLGLSCRTPAGWRLAGHQFLAADLSLTFSHADGRARIRQIALADVALRRMSLQTWLDQQRRESDGKWKHSAARQVELTCADGRMLCGLKGSSVRRGWRWRRPVEGVFFALHDVDRNKLLFVESDQPKQAEALAESSGWAERSRPLLEAQVATCG